MLTSLTSTLSIHHSVAAQRQDASSTGKKKNHENIAFKEIVTLSLLLILPAAMRERTANFTERLV